MSVDIANLTPEQQAAVDAVRAQYEAQLKAKDEDFAKIREKNAFLEEMVGKDNAPKIVNGSLEVEVSDGGRSKKTVRVGFKTGRDKVRFIDADAGVSEIVSSEVLLKIANGTELSMEESTHNPYVQKITQQKAIDYIRYLLTERSSIVEVLS